jgi:hypothetical protein
VAIVLVEDKVNHLSDVGNAKRIMKIKSKKEKVIKMIVGDNSMREFFLDILGELSIKEIISNNQLMKQSEKVVQVLNSRLLA